MKQHHLRTRCTELAPLVNILRFSLKTQLVFHFIIKAEKGERYDKPTPFHSPNSELLKEHKEQ